MLEFEWPWLLLLLVAPLLIKPRTVAISKSSKALRIPFFSQLEAAGLTSEGTSNQQKSKLLRHHVRTVYRWYERNANT